ncbi:hypothetical protein K9N68_37510 (plasmid) [Kovacikia minuta CCNUW1]|uniref:hypothetical protein n=1 Tax=Kovacikia minuta TaxID=2931930 RepID=UPI001CCCF23E|nr:hypothetical protein [Kovacikia minuta]UBF29911.1 hypothetical protein K9N68_37510 [Kovacikia minuta CCNUW1]
MNSFWFDKMCGLTTSDTGLSRLISVVSKQFDISRSQAEDLIVEMHNTQQKELLASVSRSHFLYQSIQAYSLEDTCEGMLLHLNNRELYLCEGQLRWRWK